MWKKILTIAIVSAVSGCAVQPAQPGARAKNGATTTAIDDHGVEQLYTRLDAAEKRYTTARRTAGKTGSSAVAASESKAALDDLQVAAGQCATMHGCEVQRFNAVFDHLLRLQDGAVDELADAADTPEASGEAGAPTAIAGALPEMSRSVALLKGRQLSELIELNDPVKVALEQWLTQLRPNLMLTYENYSYMRYRMGPEYEKAGLPEAVLFGILAKESGGKVHAVSRSGASGPLQFMYATGARFGLGTVNGFDQRFDPALSARANAAYLNEQLEIFNNNLELVLAAYNGGEGAMQRLVNKRPDAGFWDPKIYFELSAETRDYVPMVLAAAWLFLHPDRYNLVWPKLDGKATTIVLKAPASIDELTVCLGQDGNANGWFRTLRNLNPAYEPQQPLSVGTRIDVPNRLAATYEKMCTSGRWPELAGELRAAALPVTPAKAVARYYVVKKGDTISSITRKLGCGSSSELAGQNHLRPPHYAVHAGQQLQVNGCSRG